MAEQSGKPLSVLSLDAPLATFDLRALVQQIKNEEGWRSGADLIGLFPGGLRTRYQKEIERLIAVELLEWPCTMGDRRASPNGLLEPITRDKQVGRDGLTQKPFQLEMHVFL